MNELVITLIIAAADTEPAHTQVLRVEFEGESLEVDYDAGAIRVDKIVGHEYLVAQKF
jgi:hypothetical protein